jgi:hypothetical protein
MFTLQQWIGSGVDPWLKLSQSDSFSEPGIVIQRSEILCVLGTEILRLCELGGGIVAIRTEKTKAVCRGSRVTQEWLIGFLEISKLSVSSLPKSMSFP